jgi:histidinol phosphatase-like enzyme
LRAAAEFGIDLERSYIIGDKVSDVEAGAAVGCHPILVSHSRQAAEAHDGWIVVQDLSKVLNLVVREN